MPDFKKIPSVNGAPVAVTNQSNVFTQSQNIQVNTLANDAPELFFKALNSTWIVGIDVANNGGASDFVLAAKVNDNDTVGDIIYIARRGANAATVGIGVTPPDGSYRLQVSPQDAEPAMGGFGVRVGPSQTGKAFSIYDSNPTDRVWVDKDFYLSGAHPLSGSAISVKAPASGAAFSITDSTVTVFFGFQFDGFNLKFRYITGGVDIWRANTDGTCSFFGVGDFQTAGIRTKHESAATPTGGNSGEVRVGTDKLWVQDGGTWKSVAVSAAGAPSFASTMKWGTD